MEPITQLLSQTFFNNTIGTWVASFSLILLSIICSKIFYRIIRNYGQKLASKTKSTLDDAIFDSIEEPAGTIIGFIGTYYALEILNLPEQINAIVASSFYFIFALCGAWVLDRIFYSIFEELIVPIVDKSETDMDDQLLPILRRGIRAVIWSIAIIVGINNAGYDVGAVLAGLGIGGLAFALAAQDTVQNLFGGLTIFMDQPFKINDRIKVEGFDGSIVEIGARSTRLKTLEGRIVTLPNSKFTDQAVENVSSEECRKVKVELGLTYDMSVDQVKQSLELLMSIAENQTGVNKQASTCFSGFGDFSLNIYLIYYIEKSESISDIITDMNIKIMKEFDAAGLDMAFPTQTIYNVHSEKQNIQKVA